MNIKNMTDEQLLQYQIDLENRLHYLQQEMQSRYESRYGRSFVRTIAEETQKVLNTPSTMQRAFIGYKSPSDVESTSEAKEELSDKENR